MAVNSSQPTVYCVITFFLSYPRTSIPSIPTIPSVSFVTDDDEVLSGECNAAELCALIRGAMDIESMTRKTTWTTTMAAAAAQSRQRIGSMIPWCQKVLYLSWSTSSSFTVGDNRSPLNVLGRILSRRDLPSLNAKWRREARILEWETGRRVDDHWERKSQ